jgi:hypothetical protein
VLDAKVDGELLQEIVELVKPVPVGAVVTGVAPVTGVVTPVRVAPGFEAVAGKRIVKTPVEVLNVALDTPLAVK